MDFDDGPQIVFETALGLGYRITFAQARHVAKVLGENCESPVGIKRVLASIGVKPVVDTEARSDAD